MNEVIVINNQEVTFESNEGKVFTDSLAVARVFEKEHRNVTRDIEKLPEDEFSLLNFEQSTYMNDRGKRYKMYKMTRDGFMMIAMGFTGKKAYEWKKQYISAFNRLESYYRGFGKEEVKMLNPRAPETIRLVAQPTGTYLAQSKELIKDLDLSVIMGYTDVYKIRSLIVNLVNKGKIVEPLSNAEHYATAYYLTGDQARAVVYHSLSKRKGEALAHLDMVFSHEDKAELEEETVAGFREELDGYREAVRAVEQDRDALAKQVYDMRADVRGGA